MANKSSYQASVDNAPVSASDAQSDWSHSRRGKAGRGKANRGKARRGKSVAGTRGRGRDVTVSAGFEDFASVLSPLDDAAQSLAEGRAEFARRAAPGGSRESVLRSLDAAAGSISAASAQVDNVFGEQMGLPPDGRYEVANDVLFMYLRVDVEGSNMVSGDLFAFGEATREHLASFRSYPGVSISHDQASVDVVAEDSRGARALGTLSVAVQVTGDVAVSLTLFDQLLHLPLNEPVHLSGRFKGPEMRELGLEVEREKGVPLGAEWEFDGRIVTVESAFVDAGLDVLASGRSDEIPPPPDGGWHDSQLHDLMVQYAQEPLDRRSWNLHLLLLNRSRADNLFGVMFDSGARDINNLPRQGVAVFVDTVKRYRPNDWQRKFIQTTVHELGHALNLAHRFERAVGRADSTSFMNYDWKYRGGGNSARFWQDFSFTFDADELAFLRHGPWHSIVPGGAEFHTIPYWENTDGGYVPYRPETPGDDITLSIAPPLNDGIFEFAQPVYLTVTAKNVGDRPLNIPSYVLDPKSGFIEFVITPRPTSAGPGREAASQFRPIVHRCYDLEESTRDLLRKNDEMSSNVNLTFGSAGFTFASPGDYSVQAVLTIPWSSGQTFTYRSNKLPIRISYPRTREDERDGLDMFRWDVGMYLALGGSAVYSEAGDVLETIRERRQGQAKTVTDPLVAAIVRSQALNEWRGSVAYDQGRHHTKAGNERTARAKLQSILQIAPKVFDKETCLSMEAMIAKGSD